MKHVNIPIFIPHMGCPNMCVFCNQRTISGTSCFNEDSVDGLIENVLSTVCGIKPEIAFFGGSFTGIDRGLMIRLLDKAESYVRRGAVSGIRMSTRPDYIDKEIISILKNYTVSQVELGIQSMSDEVLRKSRRGHTADDSRRAVEMLIDAGFECVGQMMIGLPGSDIESEKQTALEICLAGCKAARIYPTVVFHDTQLYSMCISGEYVPLDTESAVERSAAALEILEDCSVSCLRIGLCESENLHSEETYAAGPNDSALGEMVKSRLFYNKICARLDELHEKDGVPEELCVLCPPGKLSQVVGHKKENKCKLSAKYGIKRFKAVEKEELIGYNIEIDTARHRLKNKEGGQCI